MCTDLWSACLLQAVGSALHKLQHALDGITDLHQSLNVLILHAGGGRGEYHSLGTYGAGELDADLMLPAMWGGIITGIGYGMVLRAGANTGGSDTIGQIISRNTSLPVGSTVMAIDVAVCALSAPVFSVENALYAGLSMVISGYVIDAVGDGGNKRRMVLIISDKFPDIAADIMYGLGRGCTKFKATGMYSGAEKPVIMVIVSRRELNTLKTIGRERDPHAIVTVADVTETFGEGFKDISA